MKSDNFLATLKLSALERIDANEVYPWANYIFVSPISYPEPNYDIYKWCEETLKGKWDIQYYSYFELEEDSVLFILRWA